MNAPIAIHHTAVGFSDRWVHYCSEHNVPYKTVNCLSSDIIEELRDVRGLLWHWSHGNATEVLMARHVIAAVEQMGVTVFPSTHTCWHFDDKVAQKYLLEAVGAPLVRSYVFYDKNEALEWIEKSAFPKVFKLRCGAGSVHVKLVRTKQQARAICKRAFGRGFPASAAYLADYRTKVRKTKGLRDFVGKLKRMPASLRALSAGKRYLPVQKGYAYFQDFLAGNTYDTRVTVIGGRAFAFMRYTRPGDFRASGSGQIEYATEKIDQRCLEIALAATEKIGAQSLAFDFVLDERQQPKIAEISYCYLADAVYRCSGFWDAELGWHAGNFWPQDLILEDLLAHICS